MSQSCHCEKPCVCHRATIGDHLFLASALAVLGIAVVAYFKPDKVREKMSAFLGGGEDRA